MSDLVSVASSKARADLSAMEGAGFYNRNSAMQAAGIGLLLPSWQKACRTAAIGRKPLVVADYGSSQGRNSLAPMRMAIEELRRRAGPDTPVEVIHSDLPSNDFSSLFETLQDDPNSYMAGQTGIFPSAIGRSYFEPILPPGRVHLGWNSWTMHWMGRSPADARDHIVAELSGSASVVVAAKQQQAVDWRLFLKARSVEMGPGAKLLSAFTGRTANETGWEWHLGELWAAILDMGSAGLLSEEQQYRLTLPVASRSLDDVRAPFAEDGSFAQLKLEDIGIVKVPDPFWEEFQCSGDRARLGRQHASVTRGWAGPTIAKLMPERDRAALVDDLFGRFAARIAANPRKHEPYFVIAVLAKQF